MKSLKTYIILLIMLLVTLNCGGSKNRGTPYAETAGRIQDAITILKSMDSIPEKSIPREIFKNAKGIAVIPGVVKASAFLGGGKGDGVMAIRRPDGSWSYPIFITTEARSIGWQIGIEKIDMVLVFKTDKSIEKAIQNELTLGGTVSAAAGPIGRYGSANTNAQFNSEIYSYTKAQGLFAGASLDGTLIRIDNSSNATYYSTKYVPADSVLQNKIPSQANLELVKQFDDELSRVSTLNADTSGKSGSTDTTGKKNP